MSEVFDPYYKWLGIKPEDQPPNHYRLLGIDLFETDPEVIDAAAERQMAHVRSYQLGPHSALSQKLLNEISTAKVCLLNPSKKDGYDAQLKTELAAGTAQADLSPIYDILSPSPADVAIPASHQPIRRRAMPISLVMTFVSLAVILCFVMGALTLSSIGNREPAGTDGTGQSHPKAMAVEPPREPSSVGEPAWQPSHQHEESLQQKNEPVIPPSPSVNSLAAPTTVSPPAPPTPILAPNPQPLVESKRPSGKETPKEVTAFAQGTSTKAPVPDATAQDKATVLVRELYKEKFDAATTAQQKRALSVELLDKAKATQDDLPARYALLKEAGSLSVKAGDVKTALQVVDEMDQTFQIDAAKMKLAILNALQTTWKTDGQTTEEEPGVKPASAPPRDNPPHSQEMVYRLKLELSEYGKGVFRMERVPSSTKEEVSGEPFKISRLPNATARKGENGICQVIHDFAQPDPLEALAMNRINISLGGNPQALVLTPGPLPQGFDAKQGSVFTYGRRLRLPVTVACDVKDVGDGNVAIKVSDFPRDLGLLVCFLRLEKNGLSSPLGVQIKWFESDKSKRVPAVTLADLKSIRPDQPAECRFRLPLPNRKISNVFIVELAKTEGREPAIVYRLEVQGRIAPQFGLELGGRGSVVFAKRTLPNFVAEKAGLESGDILSAINGQRPHTVKEAMELLASLPLGEDVVFTVERGGKTQEIRVVAE